MLLLFHLIIFKVTLFLYIISPITRFYRMKHKYYVPFIFDDFQILVEKFFNTKIKIVYTDFCGEAFSLVHLLSQHGVQEFGSSPHNLQHIIIAERKHRNTVKTTLTIFHLPSMPLKYQSLSFQIVVYFINQLPSSLLNFLELISLTHMIMALFIINFEVSIVIVALGLRMIMGQFRSESN